MGLNTTFSCPSPLTRIRSLSYPGLRTTNAGVLVVTRKCPSASVRISSADGSIARSVAATTTILPTWSILAFSNGRPEASCTIPSIVAPESTAATRTNSRTKPRHEDHLIAAMVPPFDTRRYRSTTESSCSALGSASTWRTRVLYRRATSKSLVSTGASLWKDSREYQLRASNHPRRRSQCSPAGDSYPPLRALR